MGKSDRRPYVALIATGVVSFVIGGLTFHWLGEGAQTIVFGDKESMVTTEYVPFGYCEGGTGANRFNPREGQGGLLPGTLVTVRKHGPVHIISAEVALTTRTSGDALPLRALTTDELSHKDNRWACFTDSVPQSR